MDRGAKTVYYAFEQLLQCVQNKRRLDYVSIRFLLGGKAAWLFDG